MKKLLFLLFTLPLLVIGQGEFNNWHFGDSVSICFNGGSPIVVNNSSMYAGEGSTSISDSAGNLLFYSNGEKVWNKNHEVLLLRQLYHYFPFLILQ